MLGNDYQDLKILINLIKYLLYCHTFINVIPDFILLVVGGDAINLQI